MNNTNNPMTEMVELMNTLATDIVVKQICEVSHLMLSSTVLPKDLEGYKEILGFNSPTAEREVVWSNVELHDFLMDTPMIMRRKTDGVLIFRILDKDMMPKEVAHTELNLLQLVEIRDYMFSMLEEIDRRDREFWEMVGHLMGRK
jgi:hypothetical protein